MPELVTLRTERLLLRPWCDADREPFATLNADPIVMEHFPATLSKAESDAMVDRIQSQFAEEGWGLWAVELVDRQSSETLGFVGFVGLAIPRFEAHFTPCVEVGWRLDQRAWGYGFATEAAQASLHFGFEVLKLNQIVSMTAVSNLRSQRVMQRLGMVRDPRDDFDHPLLPTNHQLRRHALFRMMNPHSAKLA